MNKKEDENSNVVELFAKNFSKDFFNCGEYCGFPILGIQVSPIMFEYSIENEGKPIKVIEDGVEHWKFEGDWGYRYYDLNFLQHREGGGSVKLSGFYNGKERPPTFFWHGRHLDCSSQEEFLKMREVFRKRENFRIVSSK